MIFEQGEDEFTFTANAISSFYFTDFLDSTKRSFIAFDYQIERDYSIPMFFEYILDGKRPLLCRESIEFTGGSSATAGFSTGAREVVYTFYMVNLKGQVVQLPKKRRKIISFFGGKELEMKKFLKENRFNLRRKADMIAIFKYYYTLL